MTNETEREIAMYILIDVTSGGAYNNIALRKELSRPHPSLDSRQRGFVTEIVNGVLRNIIYLDYTINQVSKTSTEKMKPVVLTILRMAAYQMTNMDKVPDYAICNESVELVVKKGFKGLSGFINGVIRAMLRNKDGVILPEEERYPVSYLSVRYSFPEWIVRYWLKEFDYDTVREICEKSNTRPQVTVCANTLRVKREDLAEILRNEGMIVEPCGNVPDGLNIRDTADLTASAAFKSGLFHVMDASSMAAVKILNPQPGSFVLDVCAAPGGKAFYCSELMKNTGVMTACDIHSHKLYLMEETVKRLGLENVSLKNHDARQFDPALENTADYVLVDAPCSGFGLLRKKPDIKYTRTYDDIKNLVTLQKEILENTSRYVKKGGVLVYSTCTVSKAENTDVVKWFTDKFPFEMETASYLLPHVYDGDGFFITRMVRRG